MTGKQNSIITVVGARPQFVKAGPVSRALAEEGLQEIIVHTGQHYDDGMSEVFFRELGIPAPGYHLGAGGGNHGAMTGRMLERIEEVLLKESPSAVLVYGDTKFHAGRSPRGFETAHPRGPCGGWAPELQPAHAGRAESDLHDHLSSWLYCSSGHGASQLGAEGIVNGVVVGGG